MTTAEKRLYVDTLITASTDERYRRDYEDFLEIHSLQFNNGIHERNQFLPWHRWFLLEYENLLKRINCNVTVPYWDWSLWARRPFAASLWGGENHHIGGNGTGADGCVRDGRFGQGDWTLPDKSPDGRPIRGCLKRNFTNMNDNGSRTLPGVVEIAEILNNGPNQFLQFERGLRINIHVQMHCLINGTMCSVRSAYAPEFFLHHGYIDKLWADWQKKGLGYRNAHFSTVRTPMAEAGLTTPADVIDNNNLPGGIRVCFAEPAAGVGFPDIMTAARSLSNSVLQRVRRPMIMELSEEAMTLFRVSASDRRMAAVMQKDMQMGADMMPPTTAPGRQSDDEDGDSSSKAMERMGLSLDSILSAGS